MKRKVPRMTTDEEAEAFLEQDLSDLDFSQFKPVKFEFQAKAARLNMRLPVPLLNVEGQSQGERRSLYPLYPRGSGTSDNGRAAQAEPLNFALPVCGEKVAARKRRRMRGLKPIASPLSPP